MVTSNSVISFILLLSALTSIFAMVMVWLRRKPIRGYLAWIIFLFGSWIWAFTYAIYWIDPSPENKHFWLDTTYLGVVMTPGAALIFIVQYLGNTRWVRKYWPLFLFEPILTILILWTDPYHHLFYGGMRDPLQSQIYNGGIWFWVNVIYSYALIITAIIILWMGMIRKAELLKKQTRMILLGLSFPILGNVITFLGWVPIKGVDITPVLFTFTGVTVTIAMVYYHLFDLVPIGREMLIEHMQDGVLLFNTEDRLMDINPAAIRLLNIPSHTPIGTSASEMLSAYPQMISLLHGSGIDPVELQLTEPEEKYLNIRVEEVRDQVAGTIGALLTLRDVTNEKRTELSLIDRYNEISQLQATLSEQAIRDPLTGLYNRRYLHETLPREIAQANRDNQPLSIVMLDLDHFKILNDTYGHPVGDGVLRDLGKYLLRNIRAGDIAVRFGGEEFLLVLINTPVESAFLRVETWRIEFETRLIHSNNQHVTCTFSAGIASYPVHGTKAEKLINHADIALYRSKANGRNQTTIFSGEENLQSVKV